MTNTANLPTMGHAEVLMSHWRGLFVSVLRNAAVSDESWKARLNSLDVFGLTEFREPSKHVAKPIEVDQDRLEDPKYRRFLVRKLKAPRPGKWTYHKLRIEREQLADEHYANQVGTLLAWRFTNIVLHEVETSSATMLLLTKLDVGSLTRCLDSFQRHTLNGENVSHMIVRFNVEQALDNNATLQEAMRKIAEAGAEARAQFTAEMKPVIEKTLADFDANMKPMLESINRDVDVYIEKLRIRSALNAARTQQVLDECAPDPDPEASFRHSVKMREREAREERRRNWRAQPFYVRFMPHAAVVAGAVVVTFFMEVGESRTTPWEALRDMAGWLF
jgi:hypothetical protein